MAIPAPIRHRSAPRPMQTIFRLTRPPRFARKQPHGRKGYARMTRQATMQQPKRAEHSPPPPRPLAALPTRKHLFGITGPVGSKPFWPPWRSRGLSLTPPTRPASTARRPINTGRSRLGSIACGMRRSHAHATWRAKRSSRAASSAGTSRSFSGASASATTPRSPTAAWSCTSNPMTPPTATRWTSPTPPPTAAPSAPRLKSPPSSPPTSRPSP